jgi:hypothetical protein
MYPQKVKGKKLLRKLVFCWHLESQISKSVVWAPDLDLYQNVTDMRGISLSNLDS